jgi:ribonuclease-3
VRCEGRANINLLADCFEALVAAIFIDKGFDEAYDFVLKHLFKNTLENIVKKKLYLSPKSRLQEVIQAKYKTLPLYTVLEEKGPEHKKMFKVQVSNKEKVLAVGTGSSKKMAEEQAAKNALENM